MACEKAIGRGPERIVRRGFTTEAQRTQRSEMNLSLARVDGGPLMALSGETANGERGNGERGTGNEDEHEDETIVSRTPNPKPRTPKGIHHRGAEDAKVRMNLSLARVDGGPLMAFRGETANGEWRTANGERGRGRDDCVPNPE